MRLEELTEFGWIDRIARAAARAGVPHHVKIGIGDDAAVLRPRAGEDVVLTTDAHVENVHFRRRSDPPRVVGERCVVASLSDLAAMGARPLAVTLAFAGPGGLSVRELDGILRGVLAQCGAAGAPLVGGNVARASEVSLTVTALGAVKRGRALRRDAARAGDRIFVTGRLGEAALARARAEAGGTMRHVGTARLEAGRVLTRARFAGACIDVSDGLLADLRHVLEASGVGAALDSAALPRRRGFDAACRKLGREPLSVLFAGEDYELLFTTRASAPSAAALSRRLGVEVAEIGSVTAGGLQLDGRPVAEREGWRHF